MYAFDVHCNAAFPALLLLGPVQLALSPLLLSAALVPRALSAGALRRAAGPESRGCRCCHARAACTPSGRLAQLHAASRRLAFKPPTRPLPWRPRSAVGAGRQPLPVPHVSGVQLAALPGAHRGALRTSSLGGGRARLGRLLLLLAGGRALAACCVPGSGGAPRCCAPAPASQRRPAPAGAHLALSSALHTQAFLYPIGGVALLAPLAVLAGANPTRLALRWYFGYGAA